MDFNHISNWNQALFCIPRWSHHYFVTFRLNLHSEFRLPYSYSSFTFYCSFQRVPHYSSLLNKLTFFCGHGLKRPHIKFKSEPILYLFPTFIAFVVSILFFYLFWLSFNFFIFFRFVITIWQKKCTVSRLCTANLAEGRRLLPHWTRPAHERHCNCLFPYHLKRWGYLGNIFIEFRLFFIVIYISKLFNYCISFINNHSIDNVNKKEYSSASSPSTSQTSIKDTIITIYIKRSGDN